MENLRAHDLFGGGVLGQVRRGCLLSICSVHNHMLVSDYLACIVN